MSLYKKRFLSIFLIIIKKYARYFLPLSLTHSTIFNRYFRIFLFVLTFMTLPEQCLQTHLTLLLKSIASVYTFNSFAKLKNEYLFYEPLTSNLPILKVFFVCISNLRIAWLFLIKLCMQWNHMIAQIIGHIVVWPSVCMSRFSLGIVKT